jgi:hypothetical protein
MNKQHPEKQKRPKALLQESDKLTRCRCRCRRAFAAAHGADSSNRNHCSNNQSCCRHRAYSSGACTGSTCGCSICSRFFLCKCWLSQDECKSDDCTDDLTEFHANSLKHNIKRKQLDHRVITIDQMHVALYQPHPVFDCNYHLRQVSDDVDDESTESFGATFV